MGNVRNAIVRAAIVVLVVPALALAVEGIDMEELAAWASEHRDTDWLGTSELWIDPMGNDVEVSNATLHVDAGALVYTWAHDGAEQQGELRWNGDVLLWRDSWHQPTGVALVPVPGHGSLVAAEYAYSAGAGPDWHWRIKLAERPDGALVLQMTNIAPWGEEGRAVRTILRIAK